MASLEDIAAMKADAFIGSGSRVKNFVDVALPFLSLISKKDDPGLCCKIF